MLLFVGTVKRRHIKKQNIIDTVYLLFRASLVVSLSNETQIY